MHKQGAILVQLLMIPRTHLQLAPNTSANANSTPKPYLGDTFTEPGLRSMLHTLEEPVAVLGSHVLPPLANAAGPALAGRGVDFLFDVFGSGAEKSSRLGAISKFFATGIKYIGKSNAMSTVVPIIISAAYGEGFLPNFFKPLAESDVVGLSLAAAIFAGVYHTMSGVKQTIQDYQKEKAERSRSRR